MAEQIRRTTAAEVGPQRSGIILIGQGQSAEVLLDFRNPGICYKIPFRWNDDEAKRMEQTHAMLVVAGFPVLPHFKVAWGGEFYEMTDLTNGLTHLVASTPDIYRVDDPADRQNWFRQWHAVRPANLHEFGEELNAILHLTADKRIPINNVGFFLTATPGGILHTVIADYEDGILHHDVGKPFDDDAYQGQKKRTQSYLDMVQNFFPAASRIRLK